MRIVLSSEGGKIIIPARLRQYFILAKKLVKNKSSWLEKNIDRPIVKFRPVPKEFKKKYYQQARTIVEEIIDLYQPKLKVRFNRIYIRDQKTRWGSCSAKGNLSFNWRIINLPQNLREYLVVHELTHLKHLNHSPKFWAELERHFPEAKEFNRLLGSYQM